MRSASQSGHWSHEGSARLSWPHHISIALFRTQLYKAAQLRSLGGCLPSLGPSSNLVEADHMQVQRAAEHGAYCNGPRSIQHGASCHNTVAMGCATHILSTNNSYWLCCCKIENIHNSEQIINADPNMSSAHCSRNGSKMNQGEKVDIVDFVDLSCCRHVRPCGQGGRFARCCVHCWHNGQNGLGWCGCLVDAWTDIIPPGFCLMATHDIRISYLTNQV